MWITNILLFFILSFLGLITYYLMLITRNLRKNDVYEEYSQEESYNNNKSSMVKMYDCFICNKNFLSNEAEQCGKVHNICSEICLEQYKKAGF